LDPELIDDKGIEFDLFEKKLKKFKKKGNIETDPEHYLVKINPEIEDIQKLQKMREKILKTLVTGLKGVKRGIIYYDDKINEWMIQTEGTNLAKVLSIKGVDKVRTISNHILEIEKVFGIEAARNSIIQEAKLVLEDQGLDVDIRHLMILADLMCFTGSIRQIGRHGIMGTKDSLFARASFEVTTKQLLNASISGEEEELRGIAENVIVGQVVPTIGTGTVHLGIDLDKYQEILLNK
jgi:DNA-directed RNA polymerase subunit A"